MKLNRFLKILISISLAGISFVPVMAKNKVDAKTAKVETKAKDIKAKAKKDEMAKKKIEMLKKMQQAKKTKC